MVSEEMVLVSAKVAHFFYKHQEALKQSEPLSAAFRMSL